MSSVNVDPELRKRLKRLAALKDVTQASIIKEALDLFEAEMKKVHTNETKHLGDQILDKFFKTAVLEDWEVEIINKINKSGVDIDELRMEFYDFN